MQRTAVKYSIESILNQLLSIENKAHYEVFVDKADEEFIVEFVRENWDKYIQALHCILDYKKSKLYGRGPDCSNEIRFLKCGKYKKNKQLNSRIYVIIKSNIMIMCYLYLHKDFKENKIPQKVLNAIEERCNSVYTFEDSKQELIEFDYE